MRKVNYVTKNLTKGERILISPDLSGLVWFSVILVFLLGCAIPLFFFVAVWLFLKWHMTEYAITSKKVICKTGIFSVTTSEIRLAKVESVIVERNLLDMLCGCGTLVFNGTGNTKVKFECVANPQKIKSEIDDALDDPEKNVKNVEENKVSSTEDKTENMQPETITTESSTGFKIGVGVFVGLAILGAIGNALEEQKSQKSPQPHTYTVKPTIIQENAKKDVVPLEIMFEDGNIVGLYMVHADSDNHGIVSFPACKTNEDWKKYWESIIGDSDINYVPSLIRSKKCEELNNGYRTKYSLKVTKVGEDKSITEVIKEDYDGEKVYYTNATAFGGKFHMNPWGAEAEKRTLERLKKFDAEERGKEVSSEVAVFLCNTPKDFDKLFFAMGNEVQTRKAQAKCTKIKSKTPVKIIDIDKKSLWIQYEVLSGPHKGKKLWGFPK